MPSRSGGMSSTDRFLSVAALLLVASFLISLAFYWVIEARYAERVLFFPGNITNEVSGEERIVRNYGDVERDMQVLLEEMILGPTSLYRSRVLPKETRIRLFMLRDGVVYVDLSRDVLFRDDQVHIDFEEAVAGLERSLRYNFRSIDDVVVTVDGQLPYEPYFEPENRQNGA